VMMPGRDFVSMIGCGTGPLTLSNGFRSPYETREVRYGSQRFRPFVMPDRITLFQGPRERAARGPEHLAKVVEDRTWGTKWPNLVRKRNHPTAPDVNYIYAGLQAALPEIMNLPGSQSMFEACVFRQLLLAASELASKRLE
jgi:hypothetical protein